MCQQKILMPDFKNDIWIPYGSVYGLSFTFTKVLLLNRINIHTINCFPLQGSPIFTKLYAGDTPDWTLGLPAQKSGKDWQYFYDFGNFFGSKRLIRLL